MVPVLGWRTRGTVQSVSERFRNFLSDQTHIIAAPPARVQTNAVEEVPSLLAILGNQLSELDCKLELGNALREGAIVVEIDWVAALIEKIG
jgi:hypothetical protein